MPSDLEMELNRPEWNSDLPEAPAVDELVVVRARLSEWRREWETWSDGVLGDEERERAARFRFDEDRRRHRLGRLVARVVLGRFTDTAPNAIRFEAGPHEKPLTLGASYEFNISHGGDVVLVGFARSRSLGVDVEAADRDSGEGGLARSVTTDREFEIWSEIPEERRARFFMHLWTAKESLIKATGEGLFRDPTTIECAFEGRTISGFRRIEPADSEIEAGDASDWQLRAFEVGDDAIAAATTEVRDHGTPSIRFHAFEDHYRT